MPVYPYMKGGKEHFYYAFEVKHKGKRKTIKKRGFTGKKEAERAERLARVEYEKGAYIDPTKLTYAAFATDWVKSRRDITDQTKYTNSGHLKNNINPIIGHIPLQKLTGDDILNVVDDMHERGLSNGTIVKAYNLIQTSLRVALFKELIARNPIDQITKEDRPKSSKPKIDYWTPEEVKTFLKSIKDHRQKILFILAIYTGMRRGEILGLRWRDINFESRRISIRQTLGFYGKINDHTKTDAGTRSISMSDVVMSELKRHKTVVEIEKRWRVNEDKPYHDHDLVICREDGKPVSIGNFTKFWRRKVDAAGVRYIRFHDLRHTCASLLLSAEVHPKIVQELLGHSSIKITLDTYSHLLPNLQEDAVKTLDAMLK